jgi:hypothetical protein
MKPPNRDFDHWREIYPELTVSPVMDKKTSNDLPRILIKIPMT